MQNATSTATQILWSTHASVLLDRSDMFDLEAIEDGSGTAVSEGKEAPARRSRAKKASDTDCQSQSAAAKTGTVAHVLTPLAP